VERSHRTLHSNLLRLVKARSAASENFSVMEVFADLVAGYNDNNHTTIRFPPNYVFLKNRDTPEDRIILDRVKENMLKAKIKKKRKAYSQERRQHTYKK
jgi:hypothetical protein